jgi:hypothetical protein
VTHPENLECRWALVNWYPFLASLWPKWDHLQLAQSNVESELIGLVTRIDFTETGWTFAASFGISTSVPRSALPDNGKLSFVYSVTIPSEDPAVRWHAHLVVSGKRIAGVNLTLFVMFVPTYQEEVRNTLEVTFLGDWSQVEGTRSSSSKHNPRTMFSSLTAMEIRSIRRGLSQLRRTGLSRVELRTRRKIMDLRLAQSLGL